jgi:hypothetical protein
MNFILCTEKPSLQNALAHKLIPIGINIFKVNTLDEFKAAIPVRGNVGLIDDEKLNPKELLKGVLEIKQNQEKQKARLLLLTKSHDMELVKVFVKYGVESVLQSSLHFDTIAEKTLSFLQEMSEQHSQRRFVRIKPDEKEEAAVKILLSSNNQYIIGKITDISMGGAAVKFSDDEAELMIPDSVFSSCHITLEGKKNVVADMKLVKKGGNLVAFSFEKIRASYKDILAEYIFEKIQKNIGN